MLAKHSSGITLRFKLKKENICWQGWPEGILFPSQMLINLLDMYKRTLKVVSRWIYWLKNNYSILPPIIFSFLWDFIGKLFCLFFFLWKIIHTGSKIIESISYLNTEKRSAGLLETDSGLSFMLWKWTLSLISDEWELLDKKKQCSQCSFWCACWVLFCITGQGTWNLKLMTSVGILGFRVWPSSAHVVLPRASCLLLT